MEGECSKKRINSHDDRNDPASRISNDASKCFELSDLYEEMNSTGYISSEEENRSLNFEERKILNFKIKEELKNGMLKSLDKKKINSTRKKVISAKKNPSFKSFKPKAEVFHDDMFFSEEKEKNKSKKIAPLKRTQSQFTKWAYNLRSEPKTLNGKMLV